MKKIIIIPIMFLLFSLAAIAIIELRNDKIQIDSINSTTPTKVQKQKLISYYFDEEKGMKEVKDYKKVGYHIVISFNETSWRVFTSKKNFNEVVK